MLDDEEKLTPFQKYLMARYAEYAESKGFRKVNDGLWAKWLGVNQSALNHWINGVRTPSFESAVKLSRKLGPEVFDVLGIQRPAAALSYPADLQFIVENWRRVDDETRRVIYKHVEEIVEGLTDGGHDK